MLFPNVKEVVSEFLRSWNISGMRRSERFPSIPNHTVPLKISCDLLERLFRDNQLVNLRLAMIDLVELPRTSFPCLLHLTIQPPLHNLLRTRGERKA
jgi:hypothetical protein